MKILILLSLSAILLLATFFGVDSADHAESSSGSSRKGKQVEKEPTLEEVKAQMRKLYEELVLRQQELGIACAKNDDPENLLPMIRNVEDVERRIVALRRLLYRARGMKDPKDIKKSYPMLLEAIAKLKAKKMLNDGFLWPSDRDTLALLKSQKDRYEYILSFDEKPELIDGDIVPPGIKVPD